MDKYLTIGTIVLLKNATRKVMIIGYAPRSIKSNKDYDYAGVLYPQGLIKSDEIGLFNHGDIDKIIVNGYSDDEDKEFKSKLNKIR